ncbi:MAG: nucleotide exchange factor GrpE [Candidatus Binatia bacterium]|nr:nucleotide exchange factor GrpE [Candidatus Binatia bacterium]
MSEKNDQDGSPTEDMPNAAPEAEATATEPPEPTTLQDALTIIGELQTTIAQQDQGAAKLRDQFLRERADLENFKKRMQRDKSESLRFASEPLIRELLPVIDNLERALNAAPPLAEGQADALRDGLAMVAQQFDDILTRFGVARVEAAGQPFDPTEHEALALIETTQKEPGAVLDEHLPGYRLHDRLLRPAQVTVAKAPGGQGN